MQCSLEAICIARVQLREASEPLSLKTRRTFRLLRCEAGEVNGRADELSVYKDRGGPDECRSERRRCCSVDASMLCQPLWREGRRDAAQRGSAASPASRVAA